MNPYFLMALLYFSLAVLAALDSSLSGFHLLPWFNGLRWLRIHFITLGALTEAIFGILPLLAAARLRLPRPAFRWSTWLALNAGLLTLLVGIPLVNYPLILAGGTLVFLAAGLLIAQLGGMAPAARAPRRPVDVAGRKFYIAGLSYLLLGIIVGTGLWFGWGQALRIAVPLEVHIHANNWGFMSLVFAGLLVDLYPRFAGRPLAWPRSITPIFWLMAVGAFGLVMGPWLKSNILLVPGLLLHLAGTLWLLLNVIRPLLGDRSAWTPGMLHLLVSYFWILAPVLVAPLILLKVPGFPGVGIEQSAPQALIYGWVLQFGFALIPYLFSRLFLPGRPARLGGTWLSLVAVNLGGVFLWASIFIQQYQSVLHAAAYLLWVISMLPIAAGLWRTARAGFERVEAGWQFGEGPAGIDGVVNSLSERETRHERAKKITG